VTTTTILSVRDKAPIVIVRLFATHHSNFASPTLWFRVGALHTGEVWKIRFSTNMSYISETILQDMQCTYYQTNRKSHMLYRTVSMPAMTFNLRRLKVVSKSSPKNLFTANISRNTANITYEAIFNEVESCISYYFCCCNRTEGHFKVIWGHVQVPSKSEAYKQFRPNNTVSRLFSGSSTNLRYNEHWRIPSRDFWFVLKQVPVYFLQLLDVRHFTLHLHDWLCNPQQDRTLCCITYCTVDHQCHSLYMRSKLVRCGFGVTRYIVIAVYRGI